MNRIVFGATWLLLAIVALSASALYVSDRRAGNAERQFLENRITDAIQASDRRMELRASRLQAAVSRLLEAQIDVLSELRKAEGKSVEEPAPPHAGGGSGLTSDAPDGSTPTAEGESLPQLPEGLDPREIVGKSADLRSVVEDPRLNPAGRELTRAEKYQVHSEFVHAKARMDMLAAEIHVAVTRGIEDLRARGEYLEYAPGEAYDTVPGVLTAGEETEGGGVRLFHLYPEEFREIYAKREERQEVADTAVRRVLAQLRGEGPHGTSVSSEGGSGENPAVTE